MLVEKPIADEVAQADRMLEATRRRQRLLAVAFQPLGRQAYAAFLDERRQTSAAPG